MSRSIRSRRSLFYVVLCGALQSPIGAEQNRFASAQRIGEPRQDHTQSITSNPSYDASKQFTEAGRSIREPKPATVVEPVNPSFSRHIQQPLAPQEIFRPSMVQADIMPDQNGFSEKFPSLTVQAVSVRTPVLPTIPSSGNHPIALPRIQTVAGMQVADVYWQTIADAREQLRHNAFLTAENMGWNVMEELTIRRADDLRTDGPIVALSTARNSLREAGDFLGRYGVVDRTSLERMVEAHQTLALKNVDLSRVTANIAADTYFDLARQKLMEATGGGLLAANALSIIADSRLMIESSNRIDRATSITCLRAALGGYPQSYQLANQLGYELLVDGRLAESEQLLKHALTISPSRSTWQNLAELHRRRGELSDSQACLANSVASPEPLSPITEVYELSPQQFASVSPNPIMRQPDSTSTNNSAIPVASTRYAAENMNQTAVAPQRATQKQPVQTVPQEPSMIVGRVASLFSGWR